MASMLQRFGMSIAFYKGMLYIGNRPTIDGVKQNIEVNIFDFSKDIYGESLTVYFHIRIRGDQKFNNLEELNISWHLIGRVLAGTRALDLTCTGTHSFEFLKIRKDSRHEDAKTQKVAQRLCGP